MHVVYCDWCGDPIEFDRCGHVTVSVDGYHHDGDPIKRRIHYHAGDSHDRASCLAKALGLLDWDGDFQQPDAGFEWRLVPVVERTRYADRERIKPVLGTTPLDELGLKRPVYEALVYAGFCTIEHVVDARRRGGLFVRGLGAKRMADIDRALIERGFLGAEAVA